MMRTKAARREVAKRRILTVLIYFALISIGIIMLIPFLWMVLGSFKTVREAMQFPPHLYS